MDDENHYKYIVSDVNEAKIRRPTIRSQSLRPRPR